MKTNLDKWQYGLLLLFVNTLFLITALYFFPEFFHNYSVYLLGSIGIYFYGIHLMNIATDLKSEIKQGRKYTLINVHKTLNEKEKTIIFVTFMFENRYGITVVETFQDLIFESEPIPEYTGNAYVAYIKKGILTLVKVA